MAEKVVRGKIISSDGKVLAQTLTENGSEIRDYPYGFYDAFSETEDWYPKRYLAIDQGPIAVMIENYRTGLLWKLFMSHPDVQTGLKKLGFK